MKLKRDEVYKLVNKWTENKNLVRHMLAVEVVMKALAGKLGGDEELWGVVGLLHDADYEMNKDGHPKKTLEWLKEKGIEDEIYNAVASHAWGYSEDAPKPKTKMDWALYACDELTGFIVAVALVRPDKKLKTVTVDSVLKKWNQKSFAKGVDRKQIEYCDSQLGIPLREFVEIALSAMQNISKDLGL